VRILAGQFQGVRGPATTYTPMNVYDVRLNVQGRVELTIPAAWNLGVLVMQGDSTINGQTQAKKHDFIVFKNEGERVIVDASSDVQLLVLSGEPINEPIAPYGPFVMNTRQEIEQAFADYRNGNFGYLED
jgi:redox-sensitive bicupin YhaK (pirin superfamily)